MDLTTNPTQYSFPLLKNDEIIQCLGEVGIEININELTEPNKHKDRVKSTFTSLLQLTSGQPHVDNEESKHHTFSPSLSSKLSSMDYPELHEESLQNLKFLKSTMRLMHICGVHDFGFLDLTSPSYKRFRRQLSAVINFIKFREERLGLYAELQDGREELYAGLMEVEQERKMLQEQLEATKQKADQRWKEAQMCHNDEEELESEIAQQNKVQRAIRHESSELKKKANVLKDQIDMAELGLQELEAEEKKLQSQVVQPPEELKRIMKDIEVTLKQEKNRCKEAEEEARVAGVRMTNVFNAKKDLVNAIELVDKLGREMKKYHEAEGEHEEVERAMASSQNEMTRLEELNRNHKNELQDKLSQIEASKVDSKKRLEELQSFIQDTNSELQSLEKEGRDAKERIEQEELEMNIIKNRIKEDNMKTEQEITDIVEMMHVVEAKFIEQADRFNSELCAH